jgi:hypothetical protein
MRNSSCCPRIPRAPQTSAKKLNLFLKDPQREGPENAMKSELILAPHCYVMSRAI